MGDKLIFTKLIRENIYCSDFVNFIENNVIEFKRCGQDRNQGMAVLYGPNGTGKTSFVKVLEGNETNCEFEMEFNGQIYKDNKSKLFHCIHDQNSRNIIEGNTEDFLLGDNIRKEYELKYKLENGFNEVFKTNLQKTLKDVYKVKKQSANLLIYNPNEQLAKYAKDIVNPQSSGKGIDRLEFIEFLDTITFNDIPEHYENDLLEYVCQNYIDNNSLLTKVLGISGIELEVNDGIKRIEENEIAINILNKFCDRTDCIVCETQGIDPRVLAASRTNRQIIIIESLSPISKGIIENIANSEELRSKDPLNIRARLIQFLSEGDIGIYNNIVTDINYYLDIIYKKIENHFKECICEELVSNLKEYDELLKEQPTISEEEVLFIQTVVSENIGKEIELKRDAANDNNFKLLLGGNPLLGEERTQLKLSNGEQNFISIAFELLKARNLSSSIIILDDPISSFDSIYKNKIAFCILKFLENKKQIVMSHNVDLIRLLEHQLQGSFNLYLLNNCEGGTNGFIRVKDDELKILLDMSKLLKIIRESLYNDLVDEKAYILAMVPFMRSYANITGDSGSYTLLSQLMHGYETTTVNLTEIYNRLFGTVQPITTLYELNAQDLLKYNIQSLKIIVDNDKYPLLNKALVHTLNYLVLRLQVEKRISIGYSIDVSGRPKLANIIREAFKDKTDTNHRVFFTSRKTLINEFNHFEGNMSIFQPAIDISDEALRIEREGILDYLDVICPI